MQINPDHELSSKGRLNAAIERMLHKLEESPWRGVSTPCSQYLSLDWIIKNRDAVISDLSCALRSETFTFGPGRLAIIMTGKQRRLVQRAWPERLVEQVIAEIIEELITPALSRSLFSFQRGLSNRDAISRFSEQVRFTRNQKQTLYFAKRDIQEYSVSINVGRALHKISDLLGTRSPYFVSLISQLLYPQVEVDSGDTINWDGMPTGSPLGPQIDNLYLFDLDRALDSIDGVSYIRYCDDIMFASQSPELLSATLTKAEQSLTELGLTFNPQKSTDGAFGHSVHPRFITRKKVDYLGYSISDEGAIFISSKKVTELKYAIRSIVHSSFHNSRKIKSLTKEQRIAAIVASVKQLLVGPTRHAYAALLGVFCNDKQQYKALDCWIARQVLGVVYHTRHDRVFRYLPYRKLRHLGLPSLAHLRWTRG